MFQMWKKIRAHSPIIVSPLFQVELISSLLFNRKTVLASNIFLFLFTLQFLSGCGDHIYTTLKVGENGVVSQSEDEVNDSSQDGVVQNGSFENGPVGWHSSNPDLIDITSDDAADGEYSLFLSNDSGWGREVYQSITELEPDTFYILSLTIKLSGSDINAYAGVSGKSIDVNVEEKIGSTEWKKYDIPFLTNGISPGTIQIFLRFAKSNNSGYALFDNISIRKE